MLALERPEGPSGSAVAKYEAAPVFRICRMGFVLCGKKMAAGVGEGGALNVLKLYR